MKIKRGRAPRLPIETRKVFLLLGWVFIITIITMSTMILIFILRSPSLSSLSLCFLSSGSLPRLDEHDYTTKGRRHPHHHHHIHHIMTSIRIIGMTTVMMMVMMMMVVVVVVVVVVVASATASPEH